MIANVLRLIGMLIAFVIVVGIALVALDANEDNALVDAWLEVARFFTRPFRGIFELDDSTRQIAVNWGIAAVVYVLVFALLARLATMLTGRVARR
jgi:uncharacterized Tic20 family protein